MAHGDGKRRICKEAVRLFNENGYDAVSLRQIASSAGTTIGNLTYHFSRKEDLLLAILADLHEGFSEKLDRTISGAELVESLLALVLENEENQKRYPFYFDNLAQLSATFPAIKERGDGFAKTLYDHYFWAFGKLSAEGWLEAAGGRFRPELLAYVLVDLQSGWTLSSSPYRNPQLPALPLTTVIPQLLRSHVTTGRLEEFDAICARLGLPR